jgi:hypothetical protein
MGPPSSRVPAVLLCVAADGYCQSRMMVALLGIAVHNTELIEFPESLFERGPSGVLRAFKSVSTLKGIFRGCGRVSRKAISVFLTAKVRIINKLCLLPV